MCPLPCIASSLPLFFRLSTTTSRRTPMSSTRTIINGFCVWSLFWTISMLPQKGPKKVSLFFCLFLQYVANYFFRFSLYSGHYRGWRTSGHGRERVDPSLWAWHSGQWSLPRYVLSFPHLFAPYRDCFSEHALLNDILGKLSNLLAVILAEVSRWSLFFFFFFFCSCFLYKMHSLFLCTS